MKSRKSRSILSLVTLVLPAITFADWTWTGNSTETTKYWSDTANWKGTDGAYVISEPGTINFNAPSTIGTTGANPALKISAGTESEPVTFTTGKDDNQEWGLTMAENANHAAIGAGDRAGYLVVDGGKYNFANDLVVGGKNNKNGTLVVKRGLVESINWMYICGYEASSCSGLLKVEDGGTVQVGTGEGRLVIGQQSGTKATLEQAGGKVTSGQKEAALEIACYNAKGTYKISGGSYTGKGNALIGNGNGAHGYVEVCGGEFTITGVPKLGATLGAYGEVKVSGGTFSSNDDLFIGDGGQGKLIVSGTGVVSCEGVNHEAKWVKLGSSGGAANEIDIQTGGILQIWHIERLTSEGSAVVKFNGGTLKSLNTGNDNWSLTTLIGNVDPNNKVDASVEIGEAGGIIDVGSQYNNKISAPVYGMGTLTKKGTSSLSFTGSYFGGLSVGEGTVTTPGNQTVASGQSIFLASKCNASLSPEEVQSLSSKNLWLEDGAFIKLEGVDLDFSSTTEQKLFSVSGLRIGENNITSEETDVIAYFEVEGATIPYTVKYKVADTSFYAVKVEDDNVWKGADGGDWFDHNNWTYGVPTSGSNVSVPQGTEVTVSGSVTVAGAKINGTVVLSNSRGENSTVDLGEITGSGTIAKSGEGIVSIVSVGDCGVSVNAGVLVLPRDATPSSTSISKGALLLIDVSNTDLTTEGTAINLAGIQIPEGESDPTLYVGTKGKRAVLAFEQLDDAWKITSVRLANDGEGVLNYWMPGLASETWTDNGNWSVGTVPNSASDTAVFPCDAKIVLAEGHISVRKLVIATESTVKFWSTNADKYPTLYVGEAMGGKLNLSKFGLVAQNEVKNLGGANIRCDIDIDPAVYGATQDCWIEGNSEAVLNFYGTLNAQTSAFRVNRNMNLYGTIVCGCAAGDDNYFADSTVKSGGTFKCISGGGMKFSSSSTLESGATILAEGGTITVEGGATLNDGCSILANGGTINLPWREIGSACTLGGTEEGTLSFSEGGTVACGITGSPNITLADTETETTLSLTGDNSGFSGTVSGGSAKQKLEFANDKAGSANAVFNNNAAITWNFKHSWHTELQLGALNVSNTGAYLWVENGGPIIVVGAEDDSNINCPFTGSYFTLRKVNEDTSLTLGSSVSMVENSEIELVAGSLTLPLSLLQGGTKTLKVTGGNVVIDASALTDVAAGSSVSLSKIVLAEGMDPNDYITIFNSDYVWSLAPGSEENTYVATAAYNTWKGGASGDWNDASNWTGGVPQATQTVKFDNDTEVAVAANLTVAGVIVNAAVTFNDTVGTASVALGSVSGTGSVAKKGVGLTTFTGTFTDVGFKVESGVAAVPMSSAFGAVTIGEAAALVVDIGSTTLTANTALDLFTATSLSANSDDITDAMLLRGSAANYTFSYKNQTVKANITAVHNRTANVRVWHAGASNQYLDNDEGTYYGNTPPNANDSTGLCDAVVVCETATGHGWGENTGKFRQLLVRGCTFTLDSGNSSPGINAQYIGGNGTLILNNHGFKRAWGPVVVSVGLTIDVRNTNTASWFGASGEGDNDSNIMNVNADVYCTNGYLIARIDSSINGKLVVGGSNSKVEINSGAHFGENMELVIADGIPGTFTNDSEEIIPKVKITGGTVAYSALPDTSASVYEMSGGVLTMTLAEATSVDSKKVNVVGGKVDIDVTGNTASVGDTVALAALNIVGDVDLYKTIKFSNYGDNDWTAKVQDNALVAEISALSNVNVWIGGSKGNWADAINWHYGVPTSEQTVSFPSVTEVTITLPSAPTIGTLNLGADVTFTKGTGAADKMHVGAVEGSGKIILDHWGLTQVNGQTLEIANDVVMKNVSWFGDWNYGGVVNMRGNLTVDGEMQIWMKAEIFGNISGQGSIVLKQAGACPAFHGDNRGFHGTIEKNYADGLTIDGVNAAGDDIAWRIGGDVTLNVKTGVVKFGSLDLWKNSWCVMYLPDGADTILEVGGNDKDFVFNDGYFIWGTGTDLKNIRPTIKKVGAGTLTSYLYNFKYLDVQEGKVVLNSPSTMDGASYKEISVAVASGAAIGGNAGSVADRLTISSLTLAPGAIVKQTVTGAGTTESPYTCPTLTVNGTVDVTGVKFGLDGDTSATTAKNSSFTLLTATSVTGKPVAEGSIASSIQKMIWKPTVVSDNSVVMSLVKAASGFSLFIY